jgi:hypothetical protein
MACGVCARLNRIQGEFSSTWQRMRLSGAPWIVLMGGSAALYQVAEASSQLMVDKDLVRMSHLVLF